MGIAKRHRRWFRQEGSAAHARLNTSGRFEYLQRLTHRGTADIEHTGELALGWQALTRFDLFAVEEISDVLDDRLKNIRALNGDHREFILVRHTVTSSQRHIALVGSCFLCTTSYSITVA